MRRSIIPEIQQWFSMTDARTATIYRARGRRAARGVVPDFILPGRRRPTAGRIEGVFGPSVPAALVGEGEPPPQDFLYGGRSQLEKRDGVWRIALRTVRDGRNRNEPSRDIWDEGIFQALSSCTARAIDATPVYRR